AGTPGNLGDDFTPRYVGGDDNHNNKLDPGETWLFTSADVSYQVQAGLYGNTATVTATSSTGQTATASDPAYHRGVDTPLVVQKAVNVADPLHPTPAEDANDAANPRLLAVGTNVVWTYLLTNPGTVPLTVSSFRDDAGTPGNLGDDFTPKY